MAYSVYPFYFAAAFSLFRGTNSVLGSVPALTVAIIYAPSATEAAYPGSLATNQGSREAGGEEIINHGRRIKAPPLQVHDY